MNPMNPMNPMKTMTTLVTALLVSSLAACTPPRSTFAKLEAPKAAPHVAATGLSLAPLIDARPAIAKRAHAPGVSSYWGLALVYFAFGSGRVDGIEHPGDERTTITIDGKSGSVPQQVETYLRAVITSSTGAAPGTAGAVDIADVRRAAAGHGDGITIVPILDQFDDFSMSSEDSISGGSSYQSGNTQVTTSGYSTGAAQTEVFANLRLRLVLLESRGGQIVRQATAYVATSGTGSRGLGDALTAGIEPITAQLAAFVAH
jgi:hypothetical protein